MSVGATAEGREREPPAGDLAEDGQIGRDAVELLRPAAGDAEARDHLVEDEQGPRGVGESAQRLEESRLGRDDAHVAGDGLDDDRRQRVALLLNRASHVVRVVVRADDGVRGGSRRHAGRRRDPECRDPGPGRGKQRVGVTVVAARELEDAIATGDTTGEPERAHGRLGSGGDEAHLLHRRHGVGDLLGERHLAFGRRAEGRAVGGGLLHRLDHLGIGVPEDERAPRHHPVDVPVALRVPEVGALAAGGEERLPRTHGSPGADGGVDASRDHRRRPLEEPARRQSHSASSLAQYETITSAPARLIAVRPSSAAWRSSSQPRAAAALTIAYSPLTL